MARILVTGATGLIGQNLVERLLLDGHEVYGMARKLGYDLTDQDKTSEHIKKIQPDIVYHLADVNGNPEILKNVLYPSVVANVKKFVFISSIAVRATPTPPYAKDKLHCERLLEDFRLDYTIFRPHTTYGPYQNMTDPTRNAVANFMDCLLHERECVIYGNSRRCFTYVDDIVQMLVTPTDNKIIEIGASVETDLLILADKIERIAGRKLQKRMLPAREFDIPFFPQDKNELIHETPLEVGLQKTWDFVTGKETAYAVGV